MFNILILKHKPATTPLFVHPFKTLTMEKVADLLGRKYPQFNTVVPACRVSDAMYQMCCENVDYLIVMEDDKFQGIITDHDIAGKVLFDNRPLNKIPVVEFMSRTLPVATSDNSIEYCMQIMERYGVKHLAIFDRFEFKGVVSAQDLMQEALSKGSMHFEDVEDVRQGYPWRYWITISSITFSAKASFTRSFIFSFW